MLRGSPIAPMLRWRGLEIGLTERWVKRLRRDLFLRYVQSQKSGNVIQPTIYLPASVNQIWSQTLRPAEISFISEEGWSLFSRFDGMRINLIHIPEVFEYKWSHSWPLFKRAFTNQVYFVTIRSLKMSTLLNFLTEWHE